MTVTYIFHSGFLVETPSAVLIFDYFKDPAGVVDSCLLYTSDAADD